MNPPLAIGQAQQRRSDQCPLMIQILVRDHESFTLIAGKTRIDHKFRRGSGSASALDADLASADVASACVDFPDQARRRGGNCHGAKALCLVDHLAAELALGFNESMRIDAGYAWKFYDLRRKSLEEISHGKGSHVRISSRMVTPRYNFARKAVHLRARLS